MYKSFRNFVEHATSSTETVLTTRGTIQCTQSMCFQAKQIVTDAKWPSHVLKVVAHLKRVLVIHL